MSAKFTIPLQQQKVKSHQVTAMHLFVLFVTMAVSAVLLFIFFGAERFFGAFYEKQKLPRAYFFLPPLIFLVSAIGLFVVIVKNKWVVRLGILNKILRLAEMAMLTVLIFWAASQEIIPLILLFGVALAGLLYAFFTEVGGKKHDHISFADKGIYLPYLIKGKRNWSEVERVLLRHGTLSVLFTNKKFYQWLVKEEQQAQALEEYAQTQINAHRHLRAAEW